MKLISGGVTGPQGFMASGVACGIKKGNKKDLALISCIKPAKSAGVFTTNLVKGHSITLTMENIKNETTKAILINSGNANACIGSKGEEDTKKIANSVAKTIGCNSSEVLLGSTGVIGVPLDFDKIEEGIKDTYNNLSVTGGHEASEAILTTDTVTKEYCVEFEINDKKIKIGGMAKGSGMMHPNMATMIGVLTTDANISKEYLERALKKAIAHTFNRISVDGDTSVCDMVLIMSSGMAGNDEISEYDECFEQFTSSLETVCLELSKMLVKDGEGATKLIEINVSGAVSSLDAYLAVLAIAKSPLVKTAIFGEDANWGRVMTAVGYSGASFDTEKVDITIGDLVVCKNGKGIGFNEETAKQILSGKEITINVEFNQGNYSDRMWTCDFSYDYVKINGSYRS